MLHEGGLNFPGLEQDLTLNKLGLKIHEVKIFKLCIHINDYSLLHTI